MITIPERWQSFSLGHSQPGWRAGARTNAPRESLAEPHKPAMVWARGHSPRLPSFAGRELLRVVRVFDFAVPDRVLRDHNGGMCCEPRGL